MHTEPHTKQLALPSSFNFPSSHHRDLSPAHSPPPGSRPFSSALRSSADTPLANYVLQRHRLRVVRPAYRETSHTVQVGVRRVFIYTLALVPVIDTSSSSSQIPLSALSPPKPQLGAVGGHFNSTTKIKYVPLPAIYHQQQMTQRGIRSVGLHTGRYLPSSRHTRTISDSLLNLPALESRQKTHLVNQEANLQRTRLFRSASGVHTHRMEQPFYMSGHSAQMFQKQDVPPEELQYMKAVQYAENPALYYGRGITPSTQGLQSRAVQKFEVKLKEALERSRHPGLRDSMDLTCYSRAGRPSRAITPASPILEESEQAPHSQNRQTGQAFVTQPKMHQS